MKKGILVAAAFFFAFILGCSNAMAFVHIEGRYWFTDLSGVTRASIGGATGTNLSLVRDLSLPERKDFWETRVSLELGDHQVRYGFLPLKWSGSGVLPGAIEFNGRSYTGQIDSTLKASYHRLGYKYDFLDLLGSDMGVIIELKYFDSTISVNGPAGLTSRGIKAFFPTIGVSGHMGLPLSMNFGGEITGGMLSSRQYTADGELALNINTIHFLTVSAGYRALIIYIDKRGLKEHLNLTGPFVLLRAGF